MTIVELRAMRAELGDVTILEASMFKKLKEWMSQGYEERQAEYARDWKTTDSSQQRSARIGLCHKCEKWLDWPLGSQPIIGICTCCKRVVS